MPPFGEPTAPGTRSRLIGRKSTQSVGLSVVGNRRATSTASAEAAFPWRRATRSGLLVSAP